VGLPPKATKWYGNFLKPCEGSHHTRLKPTNLSRHRLQARPVALATANQPSASRRGDHAASLRESSRLNL
jgi:hypothetical protein